MLRQHFCLFSLTDGLSTEGANAKTD